MPFETDDYLSRHFKTSGADLSKKIDELVEMVIPSTSQNLSLYREMLVTVIRMAQADRNRWDAKILLHNAKCKIAFWQCREITDFQQVEP